MRIFGLLAAAAVLAGCQSEEQFRQQWRQTAVTACVDASRTQPLPAGLDANRICNCSINRIMAGKSAADLRDHQAGAADAEAARQCAIEALGAEA